MSVSRAKSQLANEVKRAKRTKDPSAPSKVAAARAALAEAKLEAVVREVVDAAPELGPATRERLAVLLRGSS